MNVLIAPTRFLPNVGSQAVADALERGIRQCCEETRTMVRPIPGGGRGTIDIVVRALSGRIRRAVTRNASGRSVEARWALLPDGTAMIDAGEILGETELSDISRASSWGLGPMISDVARFHPYQIVVSLGDVMTHDGGIGLLEYFGLTFADERGEDIPRGLRALERVHHIAKSPNWRIPSIPLIVLYPRLLAVSGKNGVTFRDGSLKGLPTYQLAAVDRQMWHYATLLEDFFATSLLQHPASGEGGGLGLAFLAMGAQYKEATDFLLDIFHLEQYCQQADWVLTAQRTLDESQMISLAPTLSRRLLPFSTPLVAIVERLGEQYMQYYRHSLKGIYPLIDKPRRARDVERMRVHLLQQAAYRVAAWMR